MNQLPPPRKFNQAECDALLATVNFAENGLIAAIAQDATSGEILMLAWMNRAALAETLLSGRACYWSRSRQKLWRKGEESGQFQYVREIYLDCDSDAVLMKIDQVGVACHTGRKSCFYRLAEGGNWVEINQPAIDPGQLYGKN